MSSELGMSFGENHHEQYTEVLEAWANSAAGGKVTDAMAEKWGADLYAALSEDLIEALMSQDDLSEWSGKGISLPSRETLLMFSQIAAKYSLQYASRDLLDRLIKSATFAKENPEEETITASSNATVIWSGDYIATTNAGSAITAAIRPMRPSGLAKRSNLTVAQIFDMAKDKFTNVLGNHLTKNNQFTGRRRWVTDGKTSRHAALNHQIKDFNEKFTFEKEQIVAPRPVGGSPAHWSNCSCRLEYETKKGKWV